MVVFLVKISIIIPVYNVENFLNECLDSVVYQTLEDIEIICVNDGSTDSSLAILEAYAKKDGRIKIISQENGGLGNARNVGMKHISGDYVFFIDSDDYIALDALEKLYNNAISNDSDFVLFKIARFDENYKINYKNPGFALEKYFEGEDFNNFTFTSSQIKPFVLNASFAAWAKLYKKEFLDKYDDLTFPEKLAYEDVPFHVKIMLYAEKISFVPEFLYFYRFNSNSIVNTSSNTPDIFKICAIVENVLIEKNYYFKFKNEFDLFKITQILNYILFSDSEEYFKLAKEEFSKINLKNDNLVSKPLENRYRLVLNSESMSEYEIKEHELYIQELKLKNKELTKKYKKLKKQNQKLIKEKKEVKKLNKSILSSNSWKITKPLRKFKSYLM